MSNLFKKAAIFTDLHQGAKSNSLQHNVDCVNFVDWFIQEAKKEKCETCFFLGDWNHHRASINIHTLQFSLHSIEKLNANFDQVWMLPGNHDLYYRDKRDVHSLEWAKHLPNVNIVNTIFKQDDVCIAPWLVQEEYKKLKKMSCKYMFGHFELPHFKMNSMVEMPDTGTIGDQHLKPFEQVFSGHFHMRQSRKNVYYIGNAFPHNFSDLNDDARGMMILEWGNKPIFKSWPDQPIFRMYDLSTILDDPAKVLVPNSSIKVNLDIDISYEEANFIKETFIPEYKIREMTLLPIKNEAVDSGVANTLPFQSVDQIMVTQINAIESKSFDRNLLLDIYNNL